LAQSVDVSVLIVVDDEEANRRQQLARRIHEYSSRRSGPLVAVEADRARADALAGAFDDARGGTLFIDGIERLPAPRQDQLLGLLDERGERDEAVDPFRTPRVISGASPGLLAEVAASRFSERLLFRLNTIRIDAEVPLKLEESIMTVRELMSTPPQTCQPETNLAAVTHVMWEQDCGFIPVVDAAGDVIGVITDRDICVAAATRRLLPEQIAASDVMSPSVHTCLPGDTVEQALSIMKQFQVRRLPVVDASGRLQGVLSMNDIARAVGRKGAPTASAVAGTLASICASRPIVVAVA
jgi:CBS domain-containing protein